MSVGWSEADSVLLAVETMTSFPNSCCCCGRILAMTRIPIAVKSRSGTPDRPLQDTLKRKNAGQEMVCLPNMVVNSNSPKRLP